MNTQREEWECEVFDNLEALCARPPKALRDAAPIRDEQCPPAGDATALARMPQLDDDDDDWSPQRLA